MGSEDPGRLPTPGQKNPAYRHIIGRGESMTDLVCGCGSPGNERAPKDHYISNGLMPSYNGKSFAIRSAASTLNRLTYLCLTLMRFKEVLRM